MLMLQFLPRQLFPFRWTQTPPLVPALPGATQEGLLSRPLAHLQWILPPPAVVASNLREIGRGGQGSNFTCPGGNLNLKTTSCAKTLT